MEKPKYDLEERTTRFAEKVIRLCKKLPRNPINDRLIGQLVGCSSSIGANYREVNDALGRQDFVHRLKIARKEAKETVHFLHLISVANENFEKDLIGLIGEAIELRKILSTILQKCKATNRF